MCTGMMDRKLSVAPMMDWTDRHCRYLHRLLSARTLLYTEMVTAAAVVHGDADHLLRFDGAEHPVALQLGGSEPALLAQATRMAVARGYDEVNLNVGCPSDRVQSGRFGACLMREPNLVADCLKAMQDAAGSVEVTVKSRIGVDDQDPHIVLPGFIETLRNAGVRSFTIHARKAWLDGLSPKQNRDIPPLDYPLVYQMKRDFPDLQIVLNGGVPSLDAAMEHLAQGVDGVMIGRAAYHQPADILATADRRVFGTGRDRSAEEVVLAMLPYIETECSQGTRLNQITRHMLGLFAGRPGARAWRRKLSEEAHKPNAGPELVNAALEMIEPLAA